MTRLKIIVDETVSAAQFAAFEIFARQHNLDTSDCVLIKETHPGIPDSQILQHYLDETTILVDGVPVKMCPSANFVVKL